jgi:hypothetical protein
LSSARTGTLRSAGSPARAHDEPEAAGILDGTLDISEIETANRFGVELVVLGVGHDPDDLDADRIETKIRIVLPHGRSARSASESGHGSGFTNGLTAGGARHVALGEITSFKASRPPISRGQYPGADRVVIRRGVFRGASADNPGSSNVCRGTSLPLEDPVLRKVSQPPHPAGKRPNRPVHFPDEGVTRFILEPAVLGRHIHDEQVVAVESGVRVLQSLEAPHQQAPRRAAARATTPPGIAIRTCPLMTRPAPRLRLAVSDRD